MVNRTTPTCPHCGREMQPIAVPASMIGGFVCENHCEERKSETTEARRYDVRDEDGRIVASIYARSQDEAIEAFCYPGLNRDAYFGPQGCWTCERTFP